jgi:hypothetical protein
MKHRRLLGGLRPNEMPVRHPESDQTSNRERVNGNCARRALLQLERLGYRDTLEPVVT